MVLERQWVVVGLAVAGLIPFAGMAVLAGLGFESALNGFLFYSLAISAFLCGSWWGIALAKTPSSELRVVGPRLEQWLGDCECRRYRVVGANGRARVPGVSVCGPVRGRVGDQSARQGAPLLPADAPWSHRCCGDTSPWVGARHLTLLIQAISEGRRVHPTGTCAFRRKRSTLDL